MRTLLYLLLFLCLSMEVLARPSTVLSMSQTEINNRPIIGILTEPSHFKFGDEYIESTYVKYLESAGARVVPIRGNQSPEYYRSLLRNINGVLFPGGGANITTGPYYNSGKLVYEYALKANDDGDYFPIWGTCLGLELLSTLTAKKCIVQPTDSENLTLPLTLAEGYERSRLFKNMPHHIVEYLRSEAVTQNNHHFSVLVKDFEDSPEMNQFYQMLSTNHGRDNLEFVSVLEAYKYPIYATQWHPEKNVFLWSTNSAINHDLHAVQVTQYMANFFVNEARKSNHHFESADEEAKAMIENYVRIFVPDNRFLSGYFFNYTRSL